MYKNILLTVDLSDDGSWVKAAPTAVEMCKAFGANLHLLTVVPDMGMPLVEEYFPENYEEEMAKSAAALIADFANTQFPDDLKPQIHIASGSIYKEILRVAEETNTDVIVMASHRPELSDYLLGPNAARVVRHANCSVMVVRA
ncbi:MAG: universal stress protein [Rhodospirillaceae bacterium]|jgi:nucleotide-binding universal stress UspA family protein|nr:universal stress protein [Rhodospirillaceae bacterium]MBT5939852.1 universal stress protein [Rhodospirillaceae bacterium]MBT7267646.1 universal stress protein [Rhodospirillaceae bacterium]